MLMTFFGAVVGATPIAVVLTVAILLLALIELVGRKVKGDDMAAKTTETSSEVTTTTARKCVRFFRKLTGKAW
jgi:hypothetical protein